MSDWWANRLGGQQTATQQAPAPSPYAAYSPAAPAQTFVGQDGRHYQMVPVGQQPQQFVPQGPPKVTMHNLIESLAHWQGGEGARANHQCPGCGHHSVYERGPNMAPQCYECGWNTRIPVQGQPRG